MNDAAAHDVLATTLLVALAVLLSGTFAFVVRAQLVPEPRYASDVQMAVLPGPDRTWGTGDEQIRTVHEGGQSLPADALELVVDVNGVHARHAARDASLGHSFGIGETWTVVARIPAEASVQATIVLASDGGTYLLDRLDVRSTA